MSYLKARTHLCLIIIFFTSFIFPAQSTANECGSRCEPNVNLKTIYDINFNCNQEGRNGVPYVVCSGPGHNINATAGPTVAASVNGRGTQSSVFLGNGASYIRQNDFYLPLNGIDWFHRRAFSSQSSSSLNWQGEGWWGNEMMNLTVAGIVKLSEIKLIDNYDVHTCRIGFILISGSVVYHNMCIN